MGQATVMRRDWPGAYVVHCDRFQQDWGEGDSSPPPGLDLAQALLSRLALHDPALPLYSATVGEDHWEHSNWYFWVKWKTEEYQIDVEAVPESHGIWLISATRVNIGLLRALFGGNDARGVDEDFLLVLHDAIKAVTANADAKWINDKEMSKLLS